MDDLRGRRVLVTGASTGIGAAVARGFGAAGAVVGVHFNASEAEAWTVGFNWYLTSNVKAVVNYTQVQFTGGGGGTAAAPNDREDEKTVFGRLQLSF